MAEFDPREEIRLRIETCDRQALRERLDTAKLRWKLRRRIRTKDDICWKFIIDNRQSPPFRMCSAPAAYLHTPKGYLCQLHFDEAGLDAQQCVKYDPCMVFDEVLLLRGKYETTGLVEMHKRMVLFLLIDSGECELIINPPEDFGSDFLKDEPGIKFLSRGFYVSPPFPEGAVWTDLPLPLSDWLNLVLEVDLIRDDDLAWAEEVAHYSVHFFSKRIYEVFGAAVLRTCIESVYHSLDVALSESQLRDLQKDRGFNELLKSGDLRMKTKRDADQAYDLGRLMDYQSELAPIWAVAKKDARDAQEHLLLSKRWRERVKASYAIQLPDDLVEWLNKSGDEQSQKLAVTNIPLLQVRLRNGYRLSKPSEIALEHAARLCGAPPYTYAIPSLWKIYKEQKKSQDVIGNS